MLGRMSVYLPSDTELEQLLSVLKFPKLNQLLHHLHSRMLHETAIGLTHVRGVAHAFGSAPANCSLSHVWALPRQDVTKCACFIIARTEETRVDSTEKSTQSSIKKTIWKRLALLFCKPGHGGPGETTDVQTLKRREETLKDKHSTFKKEIVNEVRVLYACAC